MKMKRFLLIDGNLLLHKSNSIYSRLSTNIKGERILTGIPYGFLRTLIRLNDKYKSCHTCIAFDNSVIPKKLTNNSNTKTASDISPRRLVFPEYKQSRTEMNPDFLVGKFLLDEFLACLPITVAYATRDYEADDVISYITKKCIKQSPCEVVIVSDDKDFNQLICNINNANVFIHKKGDEILDKKAFIKKFGFSPKFFVNYLSLVGDSGDEIPGIRGLGPKRASDLIKKGFDEIETSLDASQMGIYERNKQLIRLSASRNVVASLQHGKLNIDALTQLFRKFHMVSFLRPTEQETIKLIRPINFIEKL